jgi:hypothetical protein
MTGLAAPLKTAARGPRRSGVALNATSIANALLWTSFALTVILSLLATPRRTGDAQQYVAMALQLSELRPPSLTPVDEERLQEWFASQPSQSGFPDGTRALRQPALVQNNRQDFSHFWLYPLLVAPVLRMASALDAHPLAAFTVVNAVLFGATIWATSRVFGTLAAMVIVASPLVWFVGRAQVEIFTISLLCLAMAAAASRRWGWAAIAAAIAATQNLPIAAAVPLFWTAAMADWLLTRKPASNINPGRARRALAYALAATGIVLPHPAYYLLRLGVITPQQLNGGIAGEWPTLERYFAPLIDADIGFLAWIPVAAILAVIGGIVALRSTRNWDGAAFCSLLPILCGTILAAWFLFVFAQTTNVNSGGTVFISRYALWLLPLTLPALSIPTRSLQAHWPVVALAVGIGIFAIYLGYFHPDQPERYVEHSPQAMWLMAQFPTDFHQLPEIFVERSDHVDGGPRLSAASPNCQIIFLRKQEPDLPCALTSVERSAAANLFAAAAGAVWIRRDGDGLSAVGPAVLLP